MRHPNGNVDTLEIPEGSSSGGFWLNVAGTYKIWAQAWARSVFYPTWKWYFNAGFIFYVEDQFAPAPAQNLIASANLGDNRVKLTWNPNTEHDIKQYEISRKVNTGAWTVIANTSSTSYVDTKYYYDTHSTFELRYKIRVNDLNGNWSGFSSEILTGGWPMGKAIASASGSVILEYKLYNYPNPFNPTTNIAYQIKERGYVSLKVYDIQGKLVSDLVSEIKEPGQYTVIFNADNLPSGMYIYSLKVNDFVQNHKMTLLK